MNDDTICVVFCNLADAMDFLEDDDMLDCVVMSKVIPEGEAIVVPKDEFLERLRGKKEGEGGEDVDRRIPERVHGERTGVEDGRTEKI